MVALLTFSRFAPSSCTDKSVDLPFLAGDSGMDILTAPFVEQMTWSDLVGQFIAGGSLDMTTFVGIVGCAFDHGRRDAPFSGHSSQEFGDQQSRLQ